MGNCCWKRDITGKQHKQGSEVKMQSLPQKQAKELTCWKKMSESFSGVPKESPSKCISTYAISQENIESNGQSKPQYKKGAISTKKSMAGLEGGRFIKKKNEKKEQPIKNKDKDPNTQKAEQSFISNHSKQELLVPIPTKKKKEKLVEKKEKVVEKKEKVVVSSSDNEVDKEPKIMPKKPKKEIVFPVYEYNEPPTVIVKPQIASQIQTLAHSTSPIYNSEYFPYNRVGCLFMSTGNKHNSGTGIVVGPKYVLTASHYLMDVLKRQQYESIIFKLRYKHYDQLPEFERQYRVKSYKHHKDKFFQNMKMNNVEYDYAFLELDTNQDLEEFNCFKFNLQHLELNPQEEKIMISYPYQEQIIKFVESRGNVHFQAKNVLYRFQIGHGSSGAPLLTIDNNHFYITAIHSGIVQSGEKGQINPKPTNSRVGPIFTEQMFCELMQFMTSKEGSVDLKNKLIGSKGCSLLRQCLKEQLINLNLSTFWIIERITHLGVEGCRELAITQWRNLKTINLNNNQLGGDECLKVLKDAVWPSLTELILSHNRIDGSGCRWLRQANYPNLKILNIGFNQIGNEGCLEISQAQWPFLTHIYLYSNSIETQGCSYIANANWPKLTFIDIHENFVDYEGCKYIASAHWPELKEIILDKNMIGDEGCRYLKNANWPQLQRLHLWRNGIEEQGFQDVLTSIWPKLKFVNLGQNSVQNPQKFQQRFLHKNKDLDLIL